MSKYSFVNRCLVYLFNATSTHLGLCNVEIWPICKCLVWFISPTAYRFLLDYLVIFCFVSRKKFLKIKARNWQYFTETIMDADYANDLALLTNEPAQTESLLHSLKQAAKNIDLYMNQLYILYGKSLKLLKHFTCLGSNIPFFGKWCQPSGDGWYLFPKCLEKKLDGKDVACSLEQFLGATLHKIAPVWPLTSKYTNSPSKRYGWHCWRSWNETELLANQRQENLCYQDELMTMKIMGDLIPTFNYFINVWVDLVDF